MLAWSHLKLHQLQYEQQLSTPPPIPTTTMFLRRSALALTRRSAFRPIAARSFTSSVVRCKHSHRPKFRTSSRPTS